MSTRRGHRCRRFGRLGLACGASDFERTQQQRQLNRWPQRSASTPLVRSSAFSIDVDADRAMIGAEDMRPDERIRTRRAADGMRARSRCANRRCFHVSCPLPPPRVMTGSSNALRERIDPTASSQRDISAPLPRNRSFSSSGCDRKRRKVHVTIRNKAGQNSSLYGTRLLSRSPLPFGK